MNNYITLLTTLALTCVLSGCASTEIKHVGADEFLKYATHTQKHGSSYHPVYIGEGYKQVYLETWGKVTGGLTSPKTIIYWTEIDGFSEKTLKKIQSGRVLNKE